MYNLCTSLLCGGLSFMLSTCTPSAAEKNDKVLVIKKGGTYTGTFRSHDSAIPCIRVETAEPVVLESCTLAGAGHLICATTGYEVDLIVRNCRGYGLVPSVDNQPRGRFLDVAKARRVTLEHNYLEQTAGIVVYRWTGDGSPQQTLTVRYNQARNIDGRFRAGNGSTRSSFLLLNTVQHLAGVDISFNEVRNTPGESAVEDNLNLYNSSGTAQSPIRVHDNYVQGAYPYPAISPHFTGTGMTTDGNAKTIDDATAYVEAYQNQFVSTCNAAMNIAAGHDVYYHDNRMVTSGLLPDGTKLSSTYAATAVFDFYEQSTSVFFNNRIDNNTIGFVRWGGFKPFPDRQDLSPNNCATCTHTTHLPNPITLQTEKAEWQRWSAKLKQQHQHTGPISVAPASPGK